MLSGVYGGSKLGTKSLNRAATTGCEVTFAAVSDTRFRIYILSRSIAGDANCEVREIEMYREGAAFNYDISTFKSFSPLIPPPNAIACDTEVATPFVSSSL